MRGYQYIIVCLLVLCSVGCLENVPPMSDEDAMDLLENNRQDLENLADKLLLNRDQHNQFLKDFKKEDIWVNTMEIPDYSYLTWDVHTKKQIMDWLLENKIMRLVTYEQCVIYNLDQGVSWDFPFQSKDLIFCRETDTFYHQRASDLNTDEQVRAAAISPEYNNDMHVMYIRQLDENWFIDHTAYVDWN